VNYPLKNKRALECLADSASILADGSPKYPYLQDGGKQALKMQAALKMVLAFHDPAPWSFERCQEWRLLQNAAGRLDPDEAATTRVLCDTIREVLGLAEEKHERRLV
jgi:hypothetical protein